MATTPWMLIVLALAAGLFGLSVTVIWTRDRPRIWDHLARSLVQGAIAIVTVLVAMHLFERQLAELEARQNRQQVATASAILRAHMITLGDRYRTIVKFYSLICEDEPNSEFMPCASQPRPTDLKRDYLERTDFDFMEINEPITKSASWDTFRTTTGMDENAVALLLLYTRVYTDGVYIRRVDMSDAYQRFAAELKKAGTAAMIDEDVIDELYLQMSRAQAWSIRNVVRYVCDIKRVDNLIRTSGKIDLIELARIGEQECAPYSDPFKKMMQWIAKH